MLKQLCVGGATAFLAACLIASLASASENVLSEGPEWCAFAKTYLETNAGKPFDCASESIPRCVKLNNYSCTKNFSSSPYEGEVKTALGRPVTDVDHHVIYDDPKWSLVETIKILSEYYTKKNRKTASQIAERWAPWCDTDGSKLIHLGWGRTCSDGPGAAPSSFVGPRCRKPATGLPLKGQCGPCNCPNQMASFYVKLAHKKISDDLVLFDMQGTPNDSIKMIIPQVVGFELGYRPKQSLIDQSLALYKK